jgi:hypothetical protein
MRVKLTRAQPAVSCPSSLSSSRSSIGFSYLCRALRAAHTFSGSISVNRLPYAAARYLWQRVSSLSLAMGLTTILTTIWVCPPKYA